MNGAANLGQALNTVNKLAENVKQLNSVIQGVQGIVSSGMQASGIEQQLEQKRSEQELELTKTKLRGMTLG